MHHLVNTAVVFAHRNDTISSVVRKMIDNHISSVLIRDDAGNVVGILTERDIVSKFTLLDLDLKWDKRVGTIMSFPVSYVRLSHLEADVVRLHFDLKLRHFPVVTGDKFNVANVVGMITVTDICRDYLRERQCFWTETGESKTL